MQPGACMDENDKRKRRGFFNFFGNDDSPFESIDEVFERMHEDMRERMKGMRINLDDEQIKRLSQDPNVKVYGYSMRIGPDGKPQLREFGNVRPREVLQEREEPENEEEPSERAPLVDVFTSKGKTTVVAELPGVPEESIKIALKGKSLEIRVDEGERKYYKKLELPKTFTKNKMKKSYNNGVLELVFS